MKISKLCGDDILDYIKNGYLWADNHKKVSLITLDLHEGQKSFGLLFKLDDETHFLDKIISPHPKGVEIIKRYARERSYRISGLSDPLRLPSLTLVRPHNEIYTIHWTYSFGHFLDSTYLRLYAESNLDCNLSFLDSDGVQEYTPCSRCGGFIDPLYDKSFPHEDKIICKECEDFFQWSKNL